MAQSTGTYSEQHANGVRLKAGTLYSVKQSPGDPCIVYFVQCQSTGLIKIGQAVDAVGRLKGLQAQCPTKLVTLVTFPATRATERVLHAMFSRHRQHGEWFVPHDDILAYIERVKAPGGLASAS